MIDERWAARIAELLRLAPRLLGTSVFELIRAEGYTGSYPSVTRHLHTIRGPRFTSAPAASTADRDALRARSASSTGPTCRRWTREWGLGEVQCFSAVLSWSRMRIWWFAPSIDREHTFEGLVRFFEFIGGVPKVARTDRMGALGHVPGTALLASIRLPLPSPSSTASRSRPACPPTPSARARSSDPSVTSRSGS